MILLNLAWRSLLNRKTTVLLTLLSIAVSVMLLLGVEKVRSEARTSFANTVSGADLIVGARSGPVQLLLYSVFRIGDATSNISWESYQKISAHSKVAWSIPIALGDSHRGFRVMGTSKAYFEHFRYGQRQPLAFRQGVAFDGLYDAVVGAEVAKKLGYRVGEQIVVAHGLGNTSFAKHDDKPFTVVGVLKPTGTPVDRTVHVSLEAIEAIHVDWKSGTRLPGQTISAEEAAQMDLTPKQITAFILGLKSPMATFHLQRSINNYRKEPLLAILPGVALQQLWDLMSVAEKALVAISVLVVFTGLIGMLTVLLTSLNERRREMAILRSVGARPAHILALLILETTALTFIGALLGALLLYAGLAAFKPWLSSAFGLHISLGAPSPYQWQLLGMVMIAGIMVGLIPGYRAYRYSLADGLSVRV